MVPPDGQSLLTTAVNVATMLDSEPVIGGVGRGTALTGFRATGGAVSFVGIGSPIEGDQIVHASSSGQLRFVEKLRFTV